MQLFITDYIQKDNHITITEERVVYQLSKVLRAKKGDQVAVQWKNKRTICEISGLDKTKIEALVLYEEEQEIKDSHKALAVALPNKFEKLELIVQKCTELGVEQLIFFPAKHSLLKEISEAKMERLKKISLEAVEQSRGRKIPSTSFKKNISMVCDEKEVFIAHQHGAALKNIGDISAEMKKSSEVIVMVGPEGGRHADEEKMFENHGYRKISFGENVLRTETAAIIAGRTVKNFL